MGGVTNWMPFGNTFKITTAFDGLFDIGGKTTTLVDTLASPLVNAITGTKSGTNLFDDLLLDKYDTEVLNRPAMWQRMVCTP